MNKTNDPTSNSTGKASTGTASSGRRLLVWPMALVAITLALLLVADTVSAWGRRSDHDLVDVKAHAEFFVGRMLSKLEATDEQRTRIQVLVASRIDQLASTHSERAELREEITALMTAPTIDREAIESMRATHLAHADEMSRIVSAGLADIMEELTVDQRKALSEKLGRHHGRHGWH